MNKLLLTGLEISWRPDYGEKGEVKGWHVSIYADAREVAPFGRCFGAHVMMSEAMLEQVKVNETLFNTWVNAESQQILKAFTLKGSQLGLEVNASDMFISLREQLSIGLKQIFENEMSWHHTFYLIKTLKPNESFIDDTHINLEDLESTCEGYINNGNEPKVIVIKAD